MTEHNLQRTVPLAEQESLGRFLSRHSKSRLASMYMSLLDEDEFEELRERAAEALCQDEQEPPLDTPSLDTSFHDNEMDVG